MVWGTEPIYGHFGIDLTGPNGGVVRIDDIEIEDVTAVFHRDLLSRVDVRDFGALGDGSTDDSAAFEAADAAAGGRRVLVPEGVYYLGDSVTMESPVIFEGTVTMPDDRTLALAKDFHLPAYIDAFGNEELAFKKAFQALVNDGNHESLDMGGRAVTITAPVDMQAAVATRTEYAVRRTIRNGQFYVSGGPAWDPDVVTSQASYSASDSKVLSNVVNVANIPVGALVTGNGVGREVYVKAKNVATQEVTLSSALFDAEGTQTYTFTRFKYILDFSGFDKLTRFTIADVDFLCNGHASGVMLARAGLIFHARDTFFTRPRDRAITSIGTGCQGMLVDRCQFLSREGSELAQDRVSLVLNANANDVKLRNNRATQFRHFAVLAGANSVVSGNHFFQGDSASAGIRLAGIVLTRTYCSTSIVGNYVDNCTIEWSNEHEARPDFTVGFSFSALSITDNVFLSSEVAPWFSYLVIKPHGQDHFIGGLTVTGNKFRSINGVIDRVDTVDTSYAGLDMSKGKNILFTGNTYHAITTPVYSPLVMTHSQNTEAGTWLVDTDGQLPFGGRARSVDAVVMKGAIRNGANVAQYTVPYVNTERGGDGSAVHLNWEQAVRGEVSVTIRMD
ncbi:Right handed beta helix region [Salinihabitans flavidus]|uniref:Right handed beta helix region n=1 Tax=Salinihabitans flavidus TaxID=569882 RepID=A0A1H8LH23_9RHOB|nr:Right handed beta helix region [Salinihabitans flavidus]